MSNETSVCLRVQSNARGLFTNAKHFHFTWSPDINVLCAIRKKQDPHGLWTITTNNHLSLKNDFVLSDNKDKSRFHDDYQGYVSPKLLEIVLNHYPWVSSSVEQITERR